MLLNFVLTMFLPRFNFPEETFPRIDHKATKHVLLKISSTKISYNIYNIYNRYLRNDAQLIFRERQRERERRERERVKSRVGTLIFPVF